MQRRQKSRRHVGEKNEKKEEKKGEKKKEGKYGRRNKVEEEIV